MKKIVKMMGSRLLNRLQKMPVSYLYNGKKLVNLSLGANLACCNRDDRRDNGTPLLGLEARPDSIALNQAHF
jgi:hypothetical protein